MTRLINANAAKIRIAHEAWSGMLKSPFRVMDVIDETPTVDAIPIDFIEKKIDAIRKYLGEGEGFTFTSELVSKAITYERLIEEWREENETDKRKGGQR